MNKSVLLAAAAAFALTAGGAMAAAPSVGVHGAKISPVLHTPKGMTMLYNQNSNSTGTGLVSQNFTSGSYSPTYNAQGADDFVVPSGKWKVQEVDVSGLYFNGYGPAASEEVQFFKDKHGKPGHMVADINGIQGTDNAGSFTMKLGKGASLKAGTYWVSVIANCSFVGGCGEWGWETNGTIHGNPAMWQNPDGGFGTTCSSWGTIGSCLGYTGDFMFDLQGKTR
jgi:hypothetical protein